MKSNNKLKWVKLESCDFNSQKHSTRGVTMKRCSKNMQQIYSRTPTWKCNFNKVAKQLY